MAIEVDIIGGAVHLDTLEYMETKTYTTHETRVNIKAKEADPLITLSRSKKIDTKNCWLYDFEMVENDSNILYDFDLNKDRTYSP